MSRRVGRGLVLAAGVSGAGCGTTGGRGVLQFYDRTLVAGEDAQYRRLERAAAVGGRFELSVTDATFSDAQPPAAIGELSATITEGDAFSVLSGGDTVILQVDHPGEATVEVRESGAGRTDWIQITAAEVARTELYAVPDTLFRYLEPDGGSFGVEDGGRVGVGYRLFDAAGERLSGFGTVSFGSDVGALNPVPFSAYTNGAWFQRSGGSGVATITAGDARLEVELPADGTATSLEILVDGLFPTSPGSYAVEGGLLLGMLALRDPTGTRLLAPTGTVATWTVIGGDADVLRSSASRTAGLSIEDGAFALELCAGTATLSVNYGGLDAEVSVTVTGGGDQC